MKATYKLLRTRHGRTSFALVDLELKETLDGVGISILVDPLLPIDSSAGEADPKWYPTWFEAACVGIKKSIDFGTASGISTNRGTLVVARIVGRIEDTTSDAIECAASMAACRLLGIKSVRVSDERPWTVIFDASYTE